MAIEYDKSRFLITGGAGLIGSHIADQLVKRKAKEIVVLDNFARGRRENLEWAMANGNVRIIEGDIRDLTQLQSTVNEVDYVFHQAALRITQCAEQPRLCVETLVMGTLNVIEACLKAKTKKLIAASTASVYGMADEFPTTEKHACYNNRTIYGASKVANEAMYRAFNEMSGLNYVALRYFNVYGPRMDIYGAYTEVMIRWLDCINDNRAPVIFGDGKQTMDFVYVEDVALANIKALESVVSDEVFNVASGSETNLLQVWEYLKELTGSKLKLAFEKERKVNNVTKRLAEIENAKRRIGFKSQTDMKSGLKKLIEWRQSERNVMNENKKAA